MLQKYFQINLLVYLLIVHLNKQKGNGSRLLILAGMKIKVLESRNKKSIGKTFDLGNIISGDLEKTSIKGNWSQRVKFDRTIKIGKEEFITELFHNTSAKNNLTVYLVNVVLDKFGNKRHSYFDLVEIV